jgi:hypothetical protein
MAITINGTGSITGLTAGGLPDGSITTDDLAANAVTAAKLAAGAGGKIVQYARSSGYSTQEGTTSTSWINTSFTATFTPTSSSNKVIIVISSLNITTRDSYTTHVDLARTIGGTTVQLGTTDGYSAGLMTPYSASYMDTTNLLFYQDSPATTSQITYRPVWKVDGGANMRYIFRANQAAYMHFFEVAS